MDNTLLTTVFATVLTFLSPLSPQSAESSSYAFTKALPQNAVVAYEVQRGETLASISRDLYDSDEHWTTLWNDNVWITDPTVVESGRRITVRAEKPAKGDPLRSELQAKLTNKQQVASKTVIVPTTPSVMPVATVKTPVAPPSSFESVYQQAGAQYGVPWQVLYGLHQTESGGRDGPIASGRGPQGPMQFMPGTWRAYGVDGNGDGVVDINNAVDAIHGAANFLAKHGSLDAGLRSYGGNTAGTLKLARAKGYTN